MRHISSFQSESFSKLVLLSKEKNTLKYNMKHQTFKINATCLKDAIIFKIQK